MNTKQYIIKKLKSGPLFKHWERDYSIFAMSAIAPSHEMANAKEFGENSLTLVLFTYQNGVCAYYRLLEDNENLLKIAGQKLMKNENFRKKVFEKYSFYGDKLNEIYSKIKEKETFGLSFVKQLVDLWKNIVTYQILVIHRINDYLAQYPEKKDLADEVEFLRKKYESVFGSFETSFEIMCQKIAKNYDIEDYAIFKKFTVDEFMDFLQTKEFPKDIDSRNLIVMSCSPNVVLFTGKEAEELVKEIENNLSQDRQNLLADKTIKGTTIYGKGKIKGIAQVITDFDKIKNLKEGNILVVPGTIPKYEPYYKKAKAIVADESGLLGHVAVFCREFKKPGIVGTKVATKIIKNGDFVEVDAEKGVVRRLKRK